MGNIYFLNTNVGNRSLSKQLKHNLLMDFLKEIQNRYLLVACINLCIKLHYISQRHSILVNVVTMKQLMLLPCHFVDTWRIGSRRIRMCCDLQRL